VVFILFIFETNIITLRVGEVVVYLKNYDDIRVIRLAKLALLASSHVTRVMCFDWFSVQ
jgi:hypothetical protein